MNYLDRNEFNFEPSQKVVEAIKNFDPKTLVICGRYCVIINEPSGKRFCMLEESNGFRICLIYPNF